MESTMFLEINDLKKSFGQGDSRVQVLRGIDLSVDKGEICVLLGPSGSGKSTLLNIIGGIDAPDSGYVSINGEKMVDMTEKRLTRYRREHLGYVFQMYNLIPNLTVRENIEVGAYLGDDLQNVLTQIRALKEADGAYQSFSGLKEGQSGSVRFIIETDEISK